jgi:hypothetical protein
VKFLEKKPPREFLVGGPGAEVTLRDCATIALDPDEQVTFVTDSGAQYDVARKDWGFYATPSVNGRLESFGLRAALVVSRSGLRYVMIVEEARLADFLEYLDSQDQSLSCWLDGDLALGDHLPGADRGNQ